MPAAKVMNMIVSVSATNYYDGEWRGFTGFVYLSSSLSTKTM